MIHYRYQHIPRKVFCVKEKVSTTFNSSFRLVNVYLYQMFYNHPLTQCYLLEFYRNFKLMLTTPKMLETGTKATSTSHQTSTLSETQLAKIWASASAKTHQEDTDTIFTCFIKNQLFQCSYTALYCVVLHHKPT